MDGIYIEDMPDKIRRCRNALSSYDGLFDESQGVCLGGPIHGELVAIDHNKPEFPVIGLTYRMTHYDFDGEGLWAWRLDGLNDIDCKKMLLAMVPTMLEEADEALIGEIKI